MDVIKPLKSKSKIDPFYLTFSDIKELVENYPEIPNDCKVLVQQIDEEYKDVWIDSKYFVVNTDSSLIGEYWQAWDVYYNKEENILLIHLHY